MSRPAAAVAAAAALLLGQVWAPSVWAAPAAAGASGEVVEAHHDHRPVATAPVLDLEALDEFVELPVERMEPDGGP